MGTDPCTTGLDCYEVEGKRFLKADMSQPCPLDSLTSSTFISVCILATLYPVGIPLLMYMLLRKFRVPQLAQAKVDRAIFRQMLMLFDQYVAKSLKGQISHYAGVSVAEGSADETVKEILRNRAEQMFDSACKGARETIDYQALVAYLKELGVQNDHDEEIFQAMLEADDDGNGVLDRDEFTVSTDAHE